MITDKELHAQRVVRDSYPDILSVMQKGRKTFFLHQQEKVRLLTIRMNMIHQSDTEFVTHADIIPELQKVFPEASIISVEQRRNPYMITQPAGILLDWS